MDVHCLKRCPAPLLASSPAPRGLVAVCCCPNMPEKNQTNKIKHRFPSQRFDLRWKMSELLARSNARAKCSACFFFFLPSPVVQICAVSKPQSEGLRHQHVTTTYARGPLVCVLEVPLCSLYLKRAIGGSSLTKRVAGTPCRRL